MILFGSIFLALALLTVASVASWVFGWTGEYGHSTTPFFAAATVLCLVVGISVNGVIYMKVVTYTETLPLYIEREAVYQERADAVVGQIQEALLVVYPEHERELFAGMAPENIDVYLVRYPELRAADTTLAWVEQIRGLLDGIYDQRLKAASTRMSLRWWRRNWIFSYPPMLPIPEDLGS